MKEEDLPSLAALYVRCFPPGATGEHWQEDAAFQLLDSWLRRQPDLAFVSVGSSDAVGTSGGSSEMSGVGDRSGTITGACVVAVRPWWDGNHLVDGEFFVDPDIQKRGVGSALLRQVLSIARQKYDPISWDSYTFRGDKFPLNWYKKLGFEEINEWVMIRAPIEKLIASLN